MSLPPSRRSAYSTNSQGSNQIDFCLLASLAKGIGACIEVEEGGRLYRFLPVVSPPTTDAETAKPETKVVGPPPDIMTPATLAERWYCSEKHIRNLISAGKLDCFHLGGKLIRIRGSAIEEYEGQSQISTSDKALENGREAVTPPGKSPRMKPAPRLDTRSR